MLLNVVIVASNDDVVAKLISSRAGKWFQLERMSIADTGISEQQLRAWRSKGRSYDEETNASLIFLHIMSISIAHGQVKPNDVDKREHSVRTENLCTVSIKCRGALENASDYILYSVACQVNERSNIIATVLVPGSTVGFHQISFWIWSARNHTRTKLDDKNVQRVGMKNEKFTNTTTLGETERIWYTVFSSTDTAY